MTRALAFALVLGCGTTPTPVETRAPEPLPAAAAVEETPQPVAVRINREYEGRTAKSWERSFEREGREAHDRRADIVALMELKPGMAVADVGAGTGMFTVELARAVLPGGIAYAVDPQSYFLEHVAARARDAKLDNVRTIHADQRGSGLAKGSIDVAFMCDVYHHLELPKTYLADLHAALRDGGKLVIVDYDRTRKSTRAWMRDHIRADPAEFRAEIESAGFTLLAEPKLLEENFVMIFARG
ncbi:MAG TPA: methyltransferase [Nannocystaceae bacterium]|nr:methyltransferase [Nannocystaceae bacterium]